jgi:rsbT co-antagonist protein RsbR
MAHARVSTADILKNDMTGLLADWMIRAAHASDNRISGSDVEARPRSSLKLVATAAATTEVGSADWAPVRTFLDDVLAHARAAGLFRAGDGDLRFLAEEAAVRPDPPGRAKDPAALAEETWAATELIDALGMHTVKAFQKSREDVILRQQEEMLELSTPVVKLWDGIIALPMIGTLDSARTQIVMESLLQRIVDIGAEIAIIDITGVPTVDTLVAQHLLKTVTAIRLMGADCIISGIRPQIAQTIVHLGVELEA